MGDNSVHNKKELLDYMDRLHELLVYLKDTTEKDTQLYEQIKEIINRDDS